MLIAIPTVEGMLAMHFGHCEKFALISVVDNDIKSIEMSVPPPHEPGVLPRWLSEKKVDVIICGGMGQRAQSLFEEKGIKVIVGATPDTPENIVNNYLSGNLVIGDNVCDH